MPREKGTVFSPLEKEILLELGDKHKFIIENIANNGKILSEKEKAWGLITSEYNSRHGVSSRCDGQMKALWKNMKAKAKTAVATARREQIRHLLRNGILLLFVNHIRVQIETGGGPSTNNCLTDVGSRVFGILPTQIQSFANPYDADACFHGDREEKAVQDVERSTENTLFSAANETIQMFHTSYPSTSGQSATSPKETKCFITRSQSPTEINKKKDSNTACKNGKEVVVHLLKKEHEEKDEAVKN